MEKASGNNLQSLIDNPQQGSAQKIYISIRSAWLESVIGHYAAALRGRPVLDGSGERRGHKT